MGEYYIGQYRDHYAIFDSMGRVQTQYDTHAEAKADLDSYNKTGKPLPENASMNEGLVMWGLFGVVIGISALYNRIDEAKRKKQNKKNKYNTADNAIGITEKEINELARQAKALKSDIIAKQKSSTLYKTLYQYMTKWNTDDYVGAVNALKSGESVDLGIDFRTDVYYAFVEFFNFSNTDFIKQLKDPDDDDEAEKLEIKYESESFEEMKKHLISLGFDLNKKIDGRYYSSKKYPDLIIRYVDGDDGTGIIIKPKCTLGADTFKLIAEKESKKLNEDHSEISNDPEMEKLLALAGCTIEDLDTINNEEDIELDDDDPIDANTSREIDAVMDESIGDFIRDTKNYFKNASEFLKHRKENSKSKGKDSEANIKNTSAYKEANKKLEAFGDSIGKKVAAHLKDYATKKNFKSVYKNTAFDINDIKYCPINGYDVQVSDLQDGIDYDRIPAWEEQNPGKDWQKEPQFNNDWYHELLTEGRDYAESLLEKDCPDIYAYDIGTGDGDEGLVYIDIFFTSSYINTIKEESKKIQNESVDDFDYLMESIFIDIDH